MNLVFLALVVGGFAFAAAQSWLGDADISAPMAALSRAILEAADKSVTLAIGLVGAMTLFLGLIKIAEAGGLLRVIARLIRPVMTRLFPDVPPEHPAMGAMILNLSASALGLANAATPFGIRAMQELDRLNPAKGTATDAMALFLAINTAMITLLPTSVIALRAATGSQDPAAILPSTLAASACGLIAAIAAAKLLRRVWPVGATIAGEAADGARAMETAPTAAPEPAYPGWASALIFSALAAALVAAVVYGRAISAWIVPALVAGFVLYGALRRVPVYDAFVEGARDGFHVAVRILPYLLAVLVAVSMLRASGALELLVGWLAPLTSPLGLPAEVIPMALLRPLTGSGAFAVLAAVLEDPAIGPDSYAGYLASTIQGSTETTVYVLAVYFGAVGIRRVRHALAAGLIADAASVAAAVVACLVMFQPR